MDDFEEPTWRTMICSSLLMALPARARAGGAFVSNEEDQSAPVLDRGKAQDIAKIEIASRSRHTPHS